MRFFLFFSYFFLPSGENVHAIMCSTGASHVPYMPKVDTP